MLLTISVLKTGAGTNLIRLEILPVTGRTQVALQPDIDFCGENEKRLHWCGVINKRTRIGVSVAFGVVDFLSVMCILWTPLFNGISRTGKRMCSQYSVLRFRSVV